MDERMTTQGQQGTTQGQTGETRWIDHERRPSLPCPPAVRVGAVLMRLGALVSLASVIYVPTQGERIRVHISEMLVGGASPADLAGAQMVGSVLAGLIEIALWLWLAKQALRGARWMPKASAALATLAWVGVILGWRQSLPEMHVLGLGTAVLGTAAVVALTRPSALAYFRSTGYHR